MPAKRRKIVVYTEGRANVVEDNHDEEVEVSSTELLPPPPLPRTAIPNTKFVPTTAAVSTPPPPSTALITKANLDEIPRLVLVELPKNDIVAVVRALKRLYDLLKSDLEDSLKNKRDANVTGSAGVIVRAMSKWPRDQVVQVRGCNCLRRLSFANVDGIYAICQSGGVEATIDAMKAFPNCPYVQNRAVGVLQNTLSVSLEEPSVLAVTFRFVKVLKGLKLVLRAMKKFPDDADVQADCCALFSNLALEDEMKDVMAKAGVVSAVAYTMERHYGNKEIKEEVDAFMSQMFSKKQSENGAG